MKKRRMFPVAFAFVAMLILSLPAAAATTVVTPTNTQGWSEADTRQGGDVSFEANTAPPGGGAGSLQLTTDETTTAKAQYMHAASTSLVEVSELSYWTKYVSGPPHAAASYQLAVNLTGSSGFTTFVFEPYQNGVVAPGVWQSWDVDAGQFWSSRSFSQGTCTVVAGGGGAPFYTLADLQATCPDAVVVAFGVNIGSNNPSYIVLADLVNFNGTTYDFEPYMVATDKDQCKQGGWQTVTNVEGEPFKNQGDCVSYVATGGKH